VASEASGGRASTKRASGGRQVLAVRSTLGRGYMPPKYLCLVGKDETGQVGLSAHAPDHVSYLRRRRKRY
jgi:hypothetical protein